MKKLFYKNKAAKLVLLSVLAVAVICGAVTRLSFGRNSFDSSLYPSATLSRNGDYGAVMEAEEVLDTLSQAPYILVVNRLESRNAFECTKSLVRVKTVLKGKEVRAEDQIAVYEYNNFSTYKNQGKTLHYMNRNPANLMNDQDDYLVFLSEKKMDDAYKKVDPIRQFVLYNDVGIVSIFNLNRQQTAFFDENTALTLTFDGVKEAEFVCFSQKSLDNLNRIKQAVVKQYLGS